MHPFQTLRFSMNLAALWSILGGVGLVELMKHTRVSSTHKRLVLGIAALYGVACYLGTTNLREDVHADEFAARLAPAIARTMARGYPYSAPTYIVTLEPLIVQILSPESTRVLGLYAIDDKLMQILRTEHPTLNLLYLRQSQYNNDVANERYARARGYLDSFPQYPLCREEGYSVVEIALPTTVIAEDMNPGRLGAEYDCSEIVCDRHLCPVN